MAVKMHPYHKAQLKRIAKDKSLPQKKLIWAFTLGLVAGERKDRNDINFPSQCRIPPLGTIAFTDTNSPLYDDDNNSGAKKRIRLQGNAYMRQVRYLTSGIHFTNVSKTLKHIIKFGQVLKANDKVHTHNIEQMKNAKRAIYSKIPSLPNYMENPCSIQLRLIDVAKERCLASSVIEHAEENFPFHDSEKTWNFSNNENWVNPFTFKHVHWDCCPPVKLNQCLFHIQCERQFQCLPSAQRRIQCHKNTCLDTLQEWLDRHFDTKNIILITAFLVGQLAKRHQLLQTANGLFLHIHLFWNEAEMSAKQVNELYRGSHVKRQLLDMMRRILFPLLTVPNGLINLYSFCQEVRFALMQKYIRKRASLTTYAYYCAFLQQQEQQNEALQAFLVESLNYNTRSALKRWK